MLTTGFDNRSRNPITIKNCLQDSKFRDSRKKHNIQGDIRTLLRKDCEVEKMMRLLREIEIFEEI